MTKGLIRAVSLIAASPAIAHEGGNHIHPHGFEAAISLGVIVVVALVWRISSR